ncbi:MAG: hypothetical protein ACKN9F_02875 [Methylomonas sp.]
MNQSFLRMSLLIAVSVLLNACSTTSNRDKVTVIKPIVTPPSSANNGYKPTVYSGVFAKPAAIDPAVEFWRKTYGVWQRSEVVLHALSKTETAIKSDMRRKD